MSTNEEFTNALIKFIRANVSGMDVDWSELAGDIDYAELAAELDVSEVANYISYWDLGQEIDWRALSNEIDYESLAESVSEREIARMMDVGLVAAELMDSTHLDEIAERIPLDSRDIAAYVDINDVARELDLDDLAQEIANMSEVITQIDACITDNFIDVVKAALGDQEFIEAVAAEIIRVNEANEALEEEEEGEVNERLVEGAKNLKNLDLDDELPPPPANVVLSATFDQHEVMTQARAIVEFMIEAASSQPAYVGITESMKSAWTAKVAHRFIRNLYKYQEV